MACPSCFRSGLGPEICQTCTSAGTPDGVLPVGTRLKNGSLAIGKVLGRGGFGITYLAWDFEGRRPVAIKEYLPTDFARRVRDGSGVAYSKTAAHPFEAARSKFVDEATKLSQLRLPDGSGRHQSIVEVYGCFPENDTDYIVMEYLGDRDFEKFLASQPQNRTSYQQAYRILGSVMDGLAFLHRSRPELLHLDVSADNICITDQGQVKLIDFGSARFSLKQSQRTRTKSIAVKEGYSPIELYGKQGYGPATDVYAVGATFYRAITGILPMIATDRQVVLNEQNTDPIEWPRSREIAVPPHAEEAIMQALAVRSRDRFRSIPEFQDALEAKRAAAVGVPGPGSILPGPVPPPPRPPVITPDNGSREPGPAVIPPEPGPPRQSIAPWRIAVMVLILGLVAGLLYQAVSLFFGKDWTGSAILVAFSIILIYWCYVLYRGRRGKPA